MHEPYEVQARRRAATREEADAAAARLAADGFTGRVRWRLYAWWWFTVALFGGER